MPCPKQTYKDPKAKLRLYYGARYYNPKLSNWLSVDPIALYDPIDETEHYLDGQHNGGYYNPRNMSVYGYTYQNPIIYVDPNGKQVYFGVVIGFYGTLTAITYLDKNRCGGTCYGYGKTNFMGPSTKNASKLIADGVKPVDYMDQGAMHHDLDYEKHGAEGADGLFNDSRKEIIAADKKLLARADYVLDNKSGIDPYTKKKFTNATIARAQIVHDLFTVAIALKENKNNVKSNSLYSVRGYQRSLELQKQGKCDTQCQSFIERVKEIKTKKVENESN